MAFTGPRSETALPSDYVPASTEKSCLRLGIRTFDKQLCQGSGLTAMGKKGGLLTGHTAIASTHLVYGVLGREWAQIDPDRPTPTAKARMPTRSKDPEPGTFWESVKAWSLLSKARIPVCAQSQAAFAACTLCPSRISFYARADSVLKLAWYSLHLLRASCVSLFVICPTCLLYYSRFVDRVFMGRYLCTCMTMAISVIPAKTNRSHT